MKLVKRTEECLAFPLAGTRSQARGIGAARLGCDDIEAAAAGVPAVAPAVGGISEIIAHDRTGYVANEDDELAMHLDTLLSDAAMRQVFGQRARMRVGDRHSAPALARRLEDHYAFLTAQRQTTN